jgi:peptidoglycan hydrolase CwlO-like protein
MKTSYPTLDQIKQVVRDEGKTIIAAFDQDMKSLESRVGNFEDKVGGLEDKVGGLKDKVENLEKTMNRRFDENDETHQIILGAIEDTCDRKIEDHVGQKHSFSATQ